MNSKGNIPHPISGIKLVQYDSVLEHALQNEEHPLSQTDELPMLSESALSSFQTPSNDEPRPDNEHDSFAEETIESPPARHPRALLWRALSWCLGLFFALAIAVVLTVIGIFWYLGHDLPKLNTLKDYRPFLITRITDVDGDLAMELAHQRRTPISYDEIPKSMIQAITAAEDADFFSHQGLDYFGILRAFWRNLNKRGGSRHGGSTITQQVVKTFLLSPEQTYSRKIREAILARRLEKNLTKDDILYLYLNQVYFGNRRYGLEEAARYYFGISARQLNVSQSATLAGMLKNPEIYNPGNNKKLAKRRRDYVLRRMRDEGFIPHKTYEQLKAAPISSPPPRKPLPFSSDYYTEEVRRRALEILENHLAPQHPNPKQRRITALNWLYRRGLQIETALSAPIQKEARVVLRQGLRRLDRQQGYRGPLAQLSVEKIPKEIKRLRRIQRHADPHQRHKAIVIGLSGEGVRISNGFVEGLIPWKSMKWAEKTATQQGHRFVIREKKRKDILKLGALIWTRRAPAPSQKVPSSKGGSFEGSPLLFELEQVPKIQGSIVVIEPMTHRVRALVGGRDFRSNSFNRAVQARRQPGSAFKPIVYAAGLDSQLYTAASMVNDAYFEVVVDGKRWIPKNSDRQYQNKPVRLRTALTKSLNTVAVRVLARLTPERVIKFAQKIGIRSPLEPVYPLALGASAVQPLELTNAYATFAAQGIYDRPVFITRIVDADDHVIYERLTNPRRALDAGVAYIMNDMLQDVVKKGTARKARSLKRPIAGKTGTTNQARNAWFIGYTPDLCAGVWIGYDDQTSLGPHATGTNTALPIFVDLMARVHLDKDGNPTRARPFPIPEELIFVKIDPNSGALALPQAQDFFFEAFLPGTQPTHYPHNQGPTHNPGNLYQE